MNFDANIALGGNAFPCGPSGDSFGGLSILDHFAGLAMQGMLAADLNMEIQSGLAPTAYKIASDMLAERNRRIEAARVEWKKNNPGR